MTTASTASTGAICYSCRAHPLRRRRRRHVIVGSAPFLSSRRELARLEVSEVWAGTPVPVDYPCIDGRPLFQQLPRQPSQRSRPAPHAKKKSFSDFFPTSHRHIPRQSTSSQRLYLYDAVVLLPCCARRLGPCHWTGPTTSSSRNPAPGHIICATLSSSMFKGIFCLHMIHTDILTISLVIFTSRARRTRRGPGRRRPCGTRECCKKCWRFLDPPPRRRPQPPTEQTVPRLYEDFFQLSLNSQGGACIAGPSARLHR